MYAKIVNPRTGYKVSVNGILGKSILRNYIAVLNGGAGTYRRAMAQWQRATIGPPRELGVLEKLERRQQIAESDGWGLVAGLPIDRSEYARVAREKTKIAREKREFIAMRDRPHSYAESERRNEARKAYEALIAARPDPAYDLAFKAAAGKRAATEAAHEEKIQKGWDDAELEKRCEEADFLNKNNITPHHTYGATQWECQVITASDNSEEVKRKNMMNENLKRKYGRERKRRVEHRIESERNIREEIEVRRMWETPLEDSDTLLADRNKNPYYLILRSRGVKITPAMAALAQVLAFTTDWFEGLRRENRDASLVPAHREIYSVQPGTDDHAGALFDVPYILTRFNDDDDGRRAPDDESFNHFRGYADGTGRWVTDEEFLALKAARSGDDYIDDLISLRASQSSDTSFVIPYSETDIRTFFKAINSEPYSPYVSCSIQ